MTVGFIGGGKMAQALAKAFVTSGTVKGLNILTYDPHPENLRIFEALGGLSASMNPEIVKHSDIVFLSVKPHIIAPVLREIAPAVDTTKNTIVSVAAGITLKQLAAGLPEGTRIIRVMPNTPSLVQCGASVFAMGEHCRASDATVLRDLLQSCGIAYQLKESQIDAVTGLSGSGPAFLFIMIEAMSDAGVKCGLPRDLAIRLAAQTVMGAGKMVIETNEHPAVLKDAVSSPGGTTIAGIAALESHGFRGAVIAAVEAAAARAKALSGS